MKTYPVASSARPHGPCGWLMSTGPRAGFSPNSPIVPLETCRTSSANCKFGIVLVFDLPLSARDPYVPGVTRTPPAVSASPRRKHSRQRDRILGWLRATDVHPNAADIHAALEPEMPALSLGTVYRNLELLVAQREVEEVPCVAGSARYDANLDPHHHFNCDGCGRILDVELPVPRGLARRLAGECGLRSQRIRISFFGLCPACETSLEAASEAGQSRK